MPEVTVTTSVTFDPRAVWYELAMPAGAISYWAGDLEVDDDGIQLREYPNERDGDVSVPREAGWQDVANAIAMIASGHIIDWNGEVIRLRNEYAVAACRDMLYYPDEADWDITVDDLIFQVALLGKVIYG